MDMLSSLLRSEAVEQTLAENEIDGRENGSARRIIGGVAFWQEAAVMGNSTSS